MHENDDDIRVICGKFAFNWSKILYWSEGTVSTIQKWRFQCGKQGTRFGPVKNFGDANLQALLNTIRTCRFIAG